MSDPQKKLKVMTIVGTRPEIIRLSCVILELEKCVDHVLVHTGQNYDYELSEVFFKELGIRPPDHYLNAAGATAAETIGRVLIAADDIVRAKTPDAVLILGDTNSCIAALAARKNQVTTYHMEAGNRCFDLNVPEETNRKLVDHISDFNLCYTEHSRRNLISEGLEPRRIMVTGTPMTEVLLRYRSQIDRSDVLDRLSLVKGEYLLASFHRQENVDFRSNLEAIIEALCDLSERHDCDVVVTTHPRTRRQLQKLGIDPEQFGRLRFFKPFGFFDYSKLMSNALCVISDSGTVSEEAALLGFPAVTIRNAMERPEALETGSIILTGLEKVTIARGVEQAISDHRSGNAPEIPADYRIKNTAQRVVRLMLGTQKLSARWHGLQRDQI